MTINEKIIAIAHSYLGQKEIQPNAGFEDKAFEAKMIAAGWRKGDPWCEDFAHMVWKEAYGGTEWASIIEKLFTPSALGTYYAVSKDGRIKTSKTPQPGAIGIYKHGIDPTKHEGHAIIVIDLLPPGFEDVEGNANDGSDPNVREGFIVAKKKRALGLPANPTGLNLIGFIIPNEP